jgi:hypothetical protein
MDLTFDITLPGGIALVIGAVSFALLLSLVGADPVPYGATGVVVTAVATFLGAFIASEYLGIDTYEPVAEGIAVMPAIVGGLVAGGLVEAIERYVHGQASIHGPHPI